MTERTHVWVFAGLVAAAALAAAMIDPAPFRRFTGDLAPSCAILVAGTVGLGCLIILHRLGWVGTAPLRRHGGHLPVFLAASLALALMTTVVDITVGFPRDINTPWPQAWIFYPAIGLVAEVVFHLVPLTLAVLALRRLPRLRDTKAATAIAIAAVTEPAFQVAVAAADDGLSIRAVYLAVALTLFGALQILAFRRFGFAAMYLMRCVYYLWWHLIWGAIRLDVLF